MGFDTPIKKVDKTSYTGNNISKENYGKYRRTFIGLLENHRLCYPYR